MCLSSLSLCLMFVCVCVHLLCMALILISLFYAEGAAISNICVSLPQPCKPICERTASQKLPNGLLSSPSQFELYVHTEKHFFLPFPPMISELTIRKYRGEGTGSHVRLLEQNSYVSAHGVNNILL